MRPLFFLLIFTSFTIACQKQWQNSQLTHNASDHRLESVVSMDRPMGNPAVSADGRVFFTLHPMGNPKGNKLFEWNGQNVVPFPNQSFQSRFFQPLGVFIDKQNRLWVLDYGLGLPPKRSKLFAFDLNQVDNPLVHEKVLSKKELSINDLQVSDDGAYVFMTLPGLILQDPAIVVYDVKNDRVEHRLQNHISVQSDGESIKIDGNKVKIASALPFKLGVDGLALSNDGKYLYYGAINNRGLYRIATDKLVDFSINKAELAQYVEYVSAKPFCDGMSIDLANNIYVTDIENHAVTKINTSDGTSSVLASDKALRWPDGLSFGPGGYIYVTDSALQFLLADFPFIEDAVQENKGYHLYRIQTGAAGVPGR